MVKTAKMTVFTISKNYLQKLSRTNSDYLFKLSRTNNKGVYKIALALWALN